MTWTQQDAVFFEKRITEHADSIVGAKRVDYSGLIDPYANFRRSELFGVPAWLGVIIRMTDKLSRIQSITNAAGVSQVKSELLVDTIADLINYSRILGGLIFEDLGRTPEDSFHIGPDSSG